ncbi:hypothetical protein [Clostridium porci]|uniref:RanBP2-type domain-containing protein n=1 Tax=Clostridium porci TaxID=2605778 RepID=A0A7X2NKQ4_9CLOT|nr:hypothetical protein [Clostridium porci]MSS36470.1 hypothetical protein [Clostridium porci]
MKKHWKKRAMALAMAVVVGTGGILTHTYIDTKAQPYAPMKATGLRLQWTDIPTSNGKDFGWPRKTYFDGGNSEFKDMDNWYVYCVANHSGQPDMGSEAYLTQDLRLSEWQSFSGTANAQYPMGFPKENEDPLKQFTFCLAAAATVAPGKQTDSALRDKISTTVDYILSQSIHLAIEGRMSMLPEKEAMILDIRNKEASKKAYFTAMDREFYIEPWTVPSGNPNEGETLQLEPTIRQQVLDRRSKFFDDVWAAATVLYNAMQNGGDTMSMSAQVDPNDPTKIIVTADCFGNKDVYERYYSKIYCTGGPGWRMESSSYDEATGIATIIFQGAADTDLSTLSFKFNDPLYLTDLSQPLLYEFDFITEAKKGGYQTMFCAMQKEPDIHVSTGPSDNPVPPGEGKVTLEIHRYKHSENWRTTYNVDLIKLDSETGKPLKDSRWDVLEYDTLGEYNRVGTQLGDTYLDHPESEASTIGTKYNWANDDGTQFTRWDDAEQDPCIQDNQITGEDGYLYETNTVGAITRDKAHSDSYQYTYTKGYCTGHPKPIVEYYECTHEPEDDCDCEELNAELDALAEEAWQEQVDYCETLASEGGFFHTAEEAISESAKQKMESDRDEFYNDFISLTYEYSAKEIAARNGYSLHGTHTDDIPVERVVVHSSEYLDEIAGGNSRTAVVSESDTELPSKAEAEEKDVEATMSEAEKAVVPKEVTTISVSSSGREKANTAKKNTKKEVLDVDIFAEDEGGSKVEDEDSIVPSKPESSKKATESNANDVIDDPDMDYEIDAEDNLATKSDAITDDDVNERPSAFDRFIQKVKSLFGLAKEEKEGGNARTDSEPPKTEGVEYIGAINFENSDVTAKSQGKSDIECWTFIVYDHRTEGEIHFNKRDLDLNNNKTDFDTYSRENGDGTLEGAMYGLFAMTDIMHPDSEQTAENEKDTGIVYKAGDLIAVTTTDRNGDASFMTITEAPGMTYDYEQGKIIKRTDAAWDGPGNLHTEQVKADVAVKDNEKFVGWNVSGSSKVTLTDSENGDDKHVGDHYEKHSSNQGLNKGVGQNDGITYPISNNEDNNGNCWIGRPLIVSGKHAANYYIKELSRSEGYELSVYGKDMTLTNREAFATGGDLTVDGSVAIGKMNIVQEGSGDQITSYNDIKISGVDTQNGFDVSLKNLTSFKDIAEFFTVKKETREVEKEITVKRPVVVPTIAQKDQMVILNGKNVEVSKGQTEYTLPDGTRLPIRNTVWESGDKLYAPQKTTAYFLPSADDYNAATGNSFMEKYNHALEKKRFTVPGPNDPWILVPKTGSEQTDFINCTNRLTEFAAFRAVRITAETASAYIVQYAHPSKPECLYDMTNQIVWVKKDVTVDGAASVLYAKYDAATLPMQNGRFIINDQIPSKTELTKYEDLSQITFTDNPGKTYWTYADGEQMYNDDGTPATHEEIQEFTEIVTVLEEFAVETPVDSSLVRYDASTGTYTIHFENGEHELRIRYTEESTNGIANAVYAKNNAIISYYIAPQKAGSYIEDVQLAYPGSAITTQDAGTINAPTKVQERPIRQKIKVAKDIQTLPEPKVVWYCLNCGFENTDGSSACGYCQTARTTEETKTIRYAHDTYSAVHAENKEASGDKGGVLDWLTQLLNGGVKDQSAKDVPEFRFKAYLKSNLERLYRNPDGEIVWLDRNGNVMTPQYSDTNGDGNYDTFTWKYQDAYEGKSVDWPEKDRVADDGTLQSANVQKIYTKVEHNTDSDTTSQRANNVWSTYLTPGTNQTNEVAEKIGYSTSERVGGSGNNGDASGLAIRSSDALYSYSGTNEDVAQSDKLNDQPNTEYVRLLETTQKTMEDGAGATREVELYNYEKFFDAIHAANLDIWDDDMHSSFTGTSMKNYPGQYWFETFYEKYQRDDADPDHTMENIDGADKDNTAGGDRDTSFKPFRWIRENVFGDRSDYEKYPAEHNGENTETSMSTSEFAKANAEASDAVRQFATKWYLEQEAAKLMKNNGVGEDIAKNADGEIVYDEAIYDEALFNAIAKTYNYLKPFYFYDLDTIYSVEWDSAANGGADQDYTTLSVDLDDAEKTYNVSAYLPYGVYVVVEQQPMRRDDAVNDWDNRSYTIEKPKEVVLPSVYDDTQSNDTTDNYDTHYNYDPKMTTEDQAKAENYLIRFGEEWSDEAPNAGQDERQYVIRAHGYDGDFEVYKYGLDVDLINSTENRYSNGISDGFAYAGWKQAQEEFDPLKDTYNTEHRGKDGAETTPAEEGGNDAAGYMGADKTNGVGTANGSTYNGTAIENRYFYAGISEDRGLADNVMFKGGTTDDNNPSGMQWKDDVISMTGELTAYADKYAAMLVPWTVTAPADLHEYSSENFSGYADVNERDGFYTTFLRINKTDSETGEYILHDDAIFGLYAGSRYQSFDEIEKDAKLIADATEREMFLNQFKPGDAKFYLKDAQISGTREYLMGMGARDITPIQKSSDIPAAGVAIGEICTGIVPKGTPVCVESERIMLGDQFGNRTGQMTVYTTNNDVKVAGEENAADKVYANQNTGYIVTPQPVGAGVYVLLELKAPNGYARSKPVAYEVYSDKTQYYVDGDMYQKVSAVRYTGNLMDDIDYDN